MAYRIEIEKKGETSAGIIVRNHGIIEPHEHSYERDQNRKYEIQWKQRIQHSISYRVRKDRRASVGVIRCGNIAEHHI